MSTDQPNPKPAGVPRVDAGGTSATPAARRAAGTVSISSEQLFAGASEVHITHGGSLYRLKQTALGKLILTK